MTEQTRVLGLFAKRPVAGQVKTRLAAATSPEFAAQVAEAFLRDTVTRLADFPARRVLAYAPDDAGDFFRELVAGRFDLLTQAAGDLGRRMATFFQQQHAGGARSIVLIGADSPTLPLQFIDRAFAELDKADLVLGPATDGGYYLIGVGPRLPPVFEGVRWGSEHVLTETIARLSDEWRLALLPPWYDVDTLADWHMLCGHLAALRRAGIASDLSHMLALCLTQATSVS